MEDAKLHTIIRGTYIFFNDCIWNISDAKKIHMGLFLSRERRILEGHVLVSITIHRERNTPIDNQDTIHTFLQTRILYVNGEEPLAQYCIQSGA